ncbi:protein kinase gsk3 [Ilyonectria robusta]
MHMEHKFPQIKPLPFAKVFRKADANAIDLIAQLLECTPTERQGAIDTIVYPFFDELRDPSTKLSNSRYNTGQVRELPPLFDFTRHDCFVISSRDSRETPGGYRVSTGSRNVICLLSLPGLINIIQLFHGEAQKLLYSRYISFPNTD